jgi:hypothetical protein
MQKQKSKVGGKNTSHSGNWSRVGRLFAIALFITLSGVASQKAKAQSECMGICEQNFERCLIEQYSLQGPSCIEKYEICASACVGPASVVLD